MKLSVITPSRNVAETLESCLRSVQCQEGVDVEHIVVDGGSTDGTLDVARRLGWSGLRCLQQKSSGLYAAINEGIRAATGDAIGVLGGDDFYAAPDSLQLTADALQQHDVSYADLVYVRRASPRAEVRYWRCGEFSRARMLLGWMPPHPTLFVRKEIHDSVGAYRERLRCAADYDYCLRMFSNPRLRAHYTARPRAVMRLGGVSNRSLGHLVTKSREDLVASWRVNNVMAPITIAAKNLQKLGQFFTPQSLEWNEDYARAICV